MQTNIFELILKIKN